MWNKVKYISLLINIDVDGDTSGEMFIMIISDENLGFSLPFQETSS